MAFGNRVRQRRIEEDLSQEELAAQVGISRVYLSQIERGLAENMSWGIVNKVSERLGLYLVEATPTTITDLPKGLSELKKKLNLPEADIQMLVAIQFRGKTPRTVEQWEMIYDIIAVSSKSWE